MLLGAGLLALASVDFCSDFDAASCVRQAGCSLCTSVEHAPMCVSDVRAGWMSHKTSCSTGNGTVLASACACACYCDDKCEQQSLGCCCDAESAARLGLVPVV
mmetsp:Transcript_31544/g.75574  ORF Transcript_31544/g.75574 Transcript_31544/m.75574 type:complete len:103 (-) Transcript_31544:42-350(-)